MNTGNCEAGGEPEANTAASISQASTTAGPCRVLSLDGGGAKGFYTIGILKEIEAVAGAPLCDRFRLIFGTSTGAIIAALLGLGYDVDKIHTLYKDHVPTIMRQRNRFGRTAALKELTMKVFKDADFHAFKTGVGIVATHWEYERPMIFKTSVAQAHGQTGTFVPGFGCKIGDAVQASCSAFPFFDRVHLKTSQGEKVEVADGGFCANNPTMYAITDALRALKQEPGNVRVISLGVGTYPEPKRAWHQRMLRRHWLVRLLQKTLDVNSGSMEQLRQLLFREVPTIRISETFAKPEMATDLLEHDLAKLDVLYRQGRESFRRNETKLLEFLL
jgi:predicted acylesterase/phospholipase RssA